jgi:hypothetical protein
MVKLRPVIDTIGYDPFYKEEKIDKYLEYLDSRANYMYKTGLDSKFSPESARRY